MNVNHVRAPLPAPLLVCELGLLAVVAGIFACLYPLAAGLAWLVGVWADNRARGPCLAGLALCFALGMGLGYVHLPGPPPVPPAWIATATRVEARVVDVRALPDARLRVVLADARPANGAQVPLRLHTAWTWQDATTRPLPGQTVAVTLHIRPARGFMNHDGTDITAAWQRQGIAYTAWSRGNAGEPVLSGAGTAAAVWRERLRAGLTHALYGPYAAAGVPPPDGAALIPALIFADQSAISTDMLELFNLAGLRHTLALSGQHLLVVGLLALLPVFFVTRFAPHVYSTVPRGLLIGVCSLPLAAVCLWLGGAPPSLVRAAIMLLFWVVIQWFNRPLTLLDGLCMALACMVAADPLCVFELGVQFSFLAVAGIAIAAPLLRHHTAPGEPLQARLFALGAVSPTARRIVRAGLWALALSAAAQLTTLPLALDAFGHVTPGFLANLVWLPVLGFFVLPVAWLGVLFTACGLHALARITLELAALPCTWLVHGLTWLHDHHVLFQLWGLRPHWTAVLGYGALCVALVALLARRERTTAARRLCIAGVLFVLCATGLRAWHGFAQELRIRLLDVGQGQAVLLEWPGGRGLIDSGGFASTRFDSGRDIIAPLLTANRPPQLSFAAASHMDRDHAGGFAFLLAHITVPLFMTGHQAAPAPYPPDDDPAARHPGQDALRAVFARAADRTRTMASGDRITLGPDLWLDVLWPPLGHALRGNDSLVLRLVRAGEGLALFCGDLPQREQRAMLALHPPEALRAKILVLPHHGSRRNLEPDLYHAVNPEAALASAGFGNSWGFPAPEVRESLAARHIPLYTTAEEGEVCARIVSDSELDIRSVRSVRLRKYWK